MRGLIAKILLATLLIGASRAAAQESQSPFMLPPLPSTTTPHVEFSSEHFDYQQSSGVIHLTGHVSMKQSTWTLHADEVWLYLEAKRAEAFGDVQMADGASLGFGNEGNFNFSTHEGSMKGALAGFAPWRIDGDYMTQNADRSVHFQNANFTSCNLYPYSHYHFHASSVHIRPHHYLYAWNSVLYLGKAPVFYFPFLYKSLDKEFLRTRIQPGYDHLNGQFVKTTTLYDIGPRAHGKLFLDEFGHKGIGYGNELDWRHPGEYSGGLYGYDIHEKHSGLNRWAVLGDDFQVLPSSFAFQARLQAQSDPNFNNDYNRANSFAVTSQLINNAAFVRTTKLYTTRLSYARTDSQDPTVLTRFDKITEDYPRFDFQSAPLAIGRLPWINTFTGFADNNFTAGRGFLERSAQAGWQGRKAIPLLPGLVSFEPVLAVNDTYQNRFDDAILNSTHTYLDSFIGRYTAGGDLRFDTPLGKLDVAETYTQRLTPNSINADSGAVDHGVESNLLSFTDLYRPNRYLYARVSTGYDWRVFRDHSVGFRDRVQPFTANATLMPTRNWSLLINDSYQLNGGNQTVSVQSEWGHRDSGFLSLGFSNSTSTTATTVSANDYLLSEEFGIAFSSKTWIINGAFREELHDARGGPHFHSVAVFDKELTVKRAWHDFVTMIILRERPGGVKEASVRFSLKLDTQRPIGPSPRSDTPWRTWKSDDEEVR